MPPAVLLVEKSPVEAILACAALALRPEVIVLQAEDLRSAADVLGKSPVALAILGKDALDASATTLRDFAKGGVPMVGLGVNLTDAMRRKALAAGVREVHERPREWRAYRALVAEILEGALPTRTG